ncbi:MAG: hypothetical protein R3C44_19440 [Chloroflexota bacterium]
MAIAFAMSSLGNGCDVLRQRCLRYHRRESDPVATRYAPLLLTTPISYRMARRRFFAGDMSMALDLVDKSIAARPDFWESYQLRALIFQQYAV